MSASNSDQQVVKTDDEWRAVLTPEQFSVLRKKGTERPNTGIYNKCKDEGVYQYVEIYLFIVATNQSIKRINQLTRYQHIGTGVLAVGIPCILPIPNSILDVVGPHFMR